MNKYEWICKKKDYITLKIKVYPKAKQNAIIGEFNGYLKIRIVGAPIDGKANEAVIIFFSKLFSLRKDDIKISQGTRDKYKILTIVGICLASAVKKIKRVM